MGKDYYSILGVSKGSSDAEIKKSYRKLAREWHPDVAKDKPNAETKFKEINEAYQILGNKEKREKYDQFGSAAFEGGAAGSSGNPFTNSQGPFNWSYSSGGNQGFDDPFDIFEQVFGFRGFGGGQRKGRNVRYAMSVDFVDSIKGFEQTINVDGHKLKVKLPPGVNDGTQVKFAGKGESLGKGMPSGDLYIVIQIKPHPKFARQGLDTFSIKELSIAEATLGGSVSVDVVDPSSRSGFSEKKVKIPAGTQPGVQIRLRGQGMQNPNGLGRGNHYITVKVIIPNKLNRQQKDALKELF